MQIFHIAHKSDWDRAQIIGYYMVSTRGATLSETGFIHASTAKQVTAVARTIYSNDPEELIILVMDTGVIKESGTRVHFEDGGDGELFPHIYGPILKDFVVETQPLTRDQIHKMRQKGTIKLSTEMPDLTRVTDADLPELRAISIEAFSETFASQNTPEDLEAYVAESFASGVLAEEIANPSSSFFLTRVNGKPAGYLKVNTGSAQSENRGRDALEVQRIYTLARYKGHGLGSLMMARAIEIARSENLRTVWLGVWEHNTEARGFYEHVGFAVVGTHDFRLGNDVQTDLIMELSLE